MEIVLKLYTYFDGVNDTPFPNAEEQAMFTFTYDANRMGGSPQISATVKHRLCLDDLWNDKVYATFRGEKYFIMNTPSSDKDNTDERYNHNIELLSEREVLNHVYFIDAVQGDSTVDVYKSNSTKVTFFGDVNEFVSRLNACLSYQNLDYTAVVDEGVISEDKQVSFEDKYILEALQEIFNVYEIPYYFVGKVIHVGFTENTITYPLKYGFDEALLSISKQNANYAIINKIKGQGSSDNIPYYYPNNSPKGDIGIKIVSGSMVASNFVIFDYVKFSSAMSLTDVCTVRREQSEDGILNYFIWSIDGKDVELSDLGIRLAGNVIPMAGSSFMQEKVSYITPMQNLMPSIYRESLGAQQFYEARNNTYEDGEGGYYEFENEYSDTNQRQGTTDFEDIKPTIEGMTNASGQRIDMFSAFAYDKNDNDETDEEGNYIHPYFFAKLRKFDGENGFNLFDHAIESQPMQISFTSGVCGACTFEIGVGEETQKNIVQVDDSGNLKRDENGNVLWENQKPQDRQNDTRNYEVWIALKKEDSTYGIVFPNASQNLKPSTSDTFVILGINLPTAYITAAENRLEQSLIKYMWMNNTEKFTFSIKFSRIFFTEHPEVLEQLNENSRVLIEYNGQQHTLYVDNFIYKTDDSSPLPEIEIDLVDTLSVGQNSLQTQLDSVKQDILSSIGGCDFLKQGLKYFIRKDVDDVAKGIITFINGGKFGSDEKGKPIFIINNEIKTSNFSEGDLGSGLVIKTLENGNSYIEVDELFVRKLAYFVELVIKRLTHVGGEIILSPASMTCSRVDEFEEFYRCYFNQDDGGRSIVQEFAVNDQARSQTFNIKEGTSYNVSNQYYWRLVVGIGENYIDLSKVDCDRGSTVPQAGDYIVQLGNRSDVSRQNAQILSSYGSDAPSYKQYKGIDSYSLEGKEMAKISPSGNRIVGDFILTTGQDVSTQFKVLENLIASEISSVRKEIAERDNILSNAAFSEDTLKWQTSQSYTPYTIDGKYLFFFGKPYVWKKEVAGIATVDGKNSLRIKNSSVLQLNEDFAYHPNFEEIKKLSTDEEGNPMFDEQGNPIYIIVKEARMFTIEFYYKCVESGTLSISFDGVDKTGFEDFNAVEENVVLPSNTTYENYAITGMWNGTGDLRISFTGDIYIQSILLTEDRFADIEYRYSTKFEQMDKLISMNASEIKKTNTSLEEKYAELKITADGISATVSSNYEDLSGNINELSSTVSMNHSTLILEIGRVERLVDERYDDARYWANYYLEITSNELRSEFTTGINDLETGYSALEQTVNGLSSTVASNKADADKSIEVMNAALSGVKSDITSVNGTLSTVQENLSSIGIRLGNVESNYVTTTVFNQTKDMVVAQANKWDNLGALVSQAGFILTSEAASLYVAQGNVISAINLEPGNIKIKSDKINLEGSTLFSTSTDRYSSVWIEGSQITLYSSSGTSRYVSLNASSSSPELLMYNGSDVSKLNPYQLYIVRGLYGTTFGAYSNGKIDLRADSWPTASSQVSVNGVYVEGNTLKVRTS